MPRTSLKLPSPRSHCPISFALDILGDRWTLLIVRDLLFKGNRWSGKHDPLTAAPRGLLRQIERDRDGLLRGLLVESN
jgi:DNA-binding HxlR family transcriptional regulator